jgi:alpha-ketoglutarate-dependent taurine dioxygenase
VANHVELDIDIKKIDDETAKVIFKLLTERLIVVIKNQSTNNIHLSRLIHKISRIANWQQMLWNRHGDLIGPPKECVDPTDVDTYPCQRVTGGKTENGKFGGIFPTGELKWHANLNGPTRADGVALQAIDGTEGTETHWLNTAQALKEMPAELKQKLEGVKCKYTYTAASKWADKPPEYQLKYMSKNIEEYEMYILQENIAGIKGLYWYHNNDLVTEADFYNELMEYLYQDKFIYRHHWKTGDIVLSDQLLTLHRRPLYNSDILEKRVLHRYTFPISNRDDPEWILRRNSV